MKSYVLRRLLALIPTLILASIIVFVTVRLIPGDIIELMLSQNDLSADSKSREQVVAALGLDKPMWQQYLTWISGIVLHGDLGKSLWQGTPVTEQLLARMPVTFELGAIALLVGLIIALPIGIYSAVRQDTTGDYIARSFSILLLAVPSFWLGTMVVVFPSIWWGWSPSVDYIPFSKDPVENVKNLLLPWLQFYGAGLLVHIFTARSEQLICLDGGRACCAAALAPVLRCWHVSSYFYRLK